MRRKRFAPEKIIRLLREAEVSLFQGLTVGQVSRQLGISEQTYYRWRKQYGGLKIRQAKRMKELERENGPEFTAKVVRKWLVRIGVRTLFIEPGSPWENGYNESFNGNLRDEVLNREIFYNLKEAKVIIERWRQEYNTVRPHSSLGYRPSVPEAIMSLHFDPFWLSSSKENIAQALT